MVKLFKLSMLLLLMLSMCISSSVFAYADYSTPTPPKTTVIRGGTDWDADTATPVVSKDKANTIDFFLEYHYPRAGLRPELGAKAASVNNVNMSQINFSYVKQNEGKLSTNLIPISMLEPGSIVIFQTSDKNVGKMQIIKYYRSTDFTYKGAESVPEGWKKFYFNEPVVENCHMEVNWQLMKPEGTRRLSASQNAPTPTVASTPTSTPTPEPTAAPTSEPTPVSTQQPTPGSENTLQPGSVGSNGLDPTKDNLSDASGSGAPSPSSSVNANIIKAIFDAVAKMISTLIHMLTQWKN
jgi:hypothetical protein